MVWVYVFVPFATLTKKSVSYFEVGDYTDKGEWEGTKQWFTNQMVHGLRHKRG